MWQKFFTEEQNMIRELTRKFTVEKIIPVRRELDENEEFPWELVKEMAKLDLFRIFIPEQYNGLAVVYSILQYLLRRWPKVVQV